MPNTQPQYINGDTLRLSNLLHWFERELIKSLYPNLGTFERRKLTRLCRAKDVVLVDIARSESILDNLLCSLIRHSFTSYDEMISHVEKYKARAIIQPIIERELRSAKGNAKLPTIAPDSTEISKDMTTFETRPSTRLIRSSEKNNPTFEDFSGLRIGRFIVLGLSTDRRHRWVIECDCGRYTMTTSKNIRNGLPHLKACAVCTAQEQPK